MKKKSSSKKWDKAISAINKCGKFAVFAGNATLTGAPNAGFDAIVEGSDTKIFENFRSLRSSLADVKESLEKYVKQKNKKSETKKPTYILVDELDRCSPKYAVKFLEAIHHFFCVEGLVFVIAIDQSQLRSYVEKIYGVNNDRFDGWYAKFIKASYNLQSAWDKIKKVRCPNYHIANLRPIFDIGMKKPLEDKDILYITIQLHNIIPELRNCHKNTFSNPHYLVSRILESFNLPLRQINLFIKNLKRWYIHNQINSYIRNDAELEIAAFLIALKLKNSTDYNKVINTLSSREKYNTASIEEIINKKLGKHNTFALSCVKIYGGIPNELYDELIALELYRTIPGHYDDDNHRLLLFSKREGSFYYDAPLYQCAALTIHEEIETMKDFG